MNEQPYIADETENFAVVYKPPRMHSAPLQKDGGGNTLLDWYAAMFPPVMDISGRKAGDGGLLHRLDFETQGLLLFAKNQKSLDYLLALQEQGNFIKEYGAICHKFSPPDASFPPSPLGENPCNSVAHFPLVIESFFRPFGPGRKQARPLTDACGKNRKIAKDRNDYYRTEIVNIRVVRKPSVSEQLPLKNAFLEAESRENARTCRTFSPRQPTGLSNKSIIENDYYLLTLRIRRGFRHQIRCHLAWIGCPVLNDPLYGKQTADGFLALRSTGLIFSDPENGGQRECRIAPLGKQ